MGAFVERLSNNAMDGVFLVYSLALFFAAYAASEIAHALKRALANRWVLIVVTFALLPFIFVWQVVLVIVGGVRALHTLIRDGETHWSA